ncbi:MAG: exosortase-associated EpsI family protein [Limisphaerales bacterium]
MNPAHNAVNDPKKSLFFLRLVLWLVGYVVLVVTWGVYNDWPPELSICLLFFPIHLVLAWWLYRRHGFTLETQAHVSEWDSLMAFLILAMGLASGLVLLLAVGWVGVGAVYLRPARQQIAWDEWFKLPVLFLFNFPLALDLAGSRHDWLQWMNFGLPGPMWATNDAANLLPLQMVLRLSVYALALWLPGVAFWICLPLVPLVLMASTRAARQLGQHTHESPQWSAGCAVAMSLLALAGMVLLVRRWWESHPQVTARWMGVSDWARIRSRAPWLVALAIVLQQSSLTEGWMAGRSLDFNAQGAGLLVLALAAIRWRSSSGAIHLNTRILLGLSLFVLLAAEWTDFEPLRHLSLGVLLISLCSWRRAWPWRVSAAALVTWTTTIPGTATFLVQAGLSGPTVRMLRLILFFLGLLGVIVSAWRLPEPARLDAFDDSGWQPVKRFAFILLCLLLGFQLASGFLLAPGIQSEPEIFLTPQCNAATRARVSTILADSSRARKIRIRWQRQNLDLLVVRPTRIPVRVISPETILSSAGWRIVHRRFVPQPRGQVVELQLARLGQTGCALYWFENGDRAFADYLRARRILWSGWNLTRRDLRLILLHAPTESDPKKLVLFAKSQNWFRDPAGIPELNQRSFAREILFPRAR